MGIQPEAPVMEAAVGTSSVRDRLYIRLQEDRGNRDVNFTGAAARGGGVEILPNKI